VKAERACRQGRGISLHTIEELESHSIRYFTDRQELIDYATSNRSLEGI
jgi:hypothetical protein